MPPQAAPPPNLNASWIEVLRHRAASEPDRRAYLFLADGEREADLRTYASLERRALALATALQHRELVGKRALLLLPPGLEFVDAFLGCLCAGVVAVPAYPPASNRADALAFLQYTSGSTAEPKGVMISHGNLLANEAMIQAAFDGQRCCLGWRRNAPARDTISR